MSAGEEVVAVARMDAESLRILEVLTESAISYALAMAVSRIQELQWSDASQVPIDTGLLRSSFQISLTEKSILMRWSALSPQGFDYAKVQDVGRANMVGKFYSQVMKEQARQIVLEELVRALRDAFQWGLMSG